jgi:hypothetical protein
VEDGEVIQAVFKNSPHMHKYKASFSSEITALPFPTIFFPLPSHPFSPRLLLVFILTQYYRINVQEVIIINNKEEWPLFSCSPKSSH